MNLSKTKPNPKSIPKKIESRLQKIWKLAYAAESQNDLRDLYSEWASSYDEDHEAVGFFGHLTAASLLAKHLPANRDTLEILDAGAGTGAAGTALRKLGFESLTAVDLSPDMLHIAETKGLYKKLIAADLGFPLDEYQADTFDAAILVGVFSFGQAPAHTLDEILRLVRPEGVVTFTMRTDFFESNAMGVRSKLSELENASVWELLEVTEPEAYLPNKDPEAMFRVWSYRVLPKTAPLDQGLADAVKEAFSSEEPVKEIDHRHIWNSAGSRLYERYIDTPEYYLNVTEEKILRENAEEIVAGETEIIELGCGSAQKVSHLLAAAIESGAGHTYIPIDLSPAALEMTQADVEERRFGDHVDVEPKQGAIAEILPELAHLPNKLIVFFGSSIGNFESLAETVEFLRTVRDGMRDGDRFLVGIDLHKDEDVLQAAYQAGEPNRAFFLNLVRRINDELGGEFDLRAFRQATSYDQGQTYKGIEDRCVNFKLATEKDQQVHLSELDEDVTLKEGESIRVGVSRKYRSEDIAKLAAEAGLELSRQWIDDRGYFSVNELTRV